MVNLHLFKLAQSIFHGELRPLNWSLRCGRYRSPLMLGEVDRHRAPCFGGRKFGPRAEDPTLFFTKINMLNDVKSTISLLQPS